MADLLSVIMYDNGSGHIFAMVHVCFVSCNLECCFFAHSTWVHVYVNISKYISKIIYIYVYKYLKYPKKYIYLGVDYL